MRQTMDKNTIAKTMEDIEFVFESGKMNILGHRFINNKRFNKSISETKEVLQNLVSEAIDIQDKKEEIIESAYKESQEMIKETEDYIENLNIVQKSKALAEEIIDKANEEANKTILEAENIKKASIEYGERVKEKLIEQGYEFLQEKISVALNAINTAQSEYRSSYNEVKNTLMNALSEVSEPIVEEAGSDEEKVS